MEDRVGEGSHCCVQGLLSESRVFHLATWCLSMINIIIIIVIIVVVVVVVVVVIIPCHLVPLQGQESKHLKKFKHVELNF